MSVGQIVKLGDSPFKVVKVYGQYVDIQQKFSLGLVIEKVKISELNI